MRNLPIILLVSAAALLFLFVPIPAPGADRAPHRATSEALPPDLRTETGFDPADSAGLFIGVNEFDDDSLEDLDFAVDDAVDLAHTLVNLQLILPENVVLALSGEPAKDETKQRLKALEDAGASRIDARLGNVIGALDQIPKRAGPNGILFIQISSHGFDQAGVALVGFADIRNSNLNRTAMPVTEISDSIRGTESAPTATRRRLILVDACREKTWNASGTRAASEPVRTSHTFVDAFAKSAGQAVLYAADVGRYSYESDSIRQGVFTYFILEGLRGAAPAGDDGILTISELSHWVGEMVEESTRLNRKPQIIRPEIPTDAGRIPLAVNPEITGRIKQWEVRMQKARETFREKIDFQVITGTMADDVYQAMVDLTPEDGEGLVSRLERLRAETLGPSEFAAWWELFGKAEYLTAVPEPSPVPVRALTSSVRGTPAAAGLRENEIKTIDLGGGVTMNLVWIPGGTFTMGTPLEDKIQFDDELPQTRVTLTEGFWMGETEVTVAQFERFILETGYKTEAEAHQGAYGWTGSGFALDESFTWKFPGFPQTGNYPVTCVTWNDSMIFCEWLEEKAGLEISLPTEAQWEYACRAGTTTRYSWGDSRSASSAKPYAWYNENADDEKWSPPHADQEGTQLVGTREPNPWGLYDMHGNVWELCLDRYQDELPGGVVSDPKGPKSGEFRVARGGSWNLTHDHLRCADRDKMHTTNRFSRLGFRIVSP